MIKLNSDQAQVIGALENLDRILVIWPTGFGKSILFYYWKQKYPQSRIVVLTPLIALMDDQVLRARSQKIQAYAVHSLTPLDKIKKARNTIQSGTGFLLYLTPEKIRMNPDFGNLLTGNIDLLVIDEIHLVSQWGWNFRPDWRWIPQLIERLSPKKVLGLTASASPSTLEVLNQMFQWQQSFRKSPYKGNISISIKSVSTPEEQLHSALEHWKQWAASARSSAITYFTLIKTLKSIEKYLRKNHSNWPLLTYHGQMVQRKKTLQNFLQTTQILVLATPAFGMGVDKPNIHYLMHYNLPASLEQWIQEIGRSGRDGQPSQALTLYFNEDILTHLSFIDQMPDELALYEMYEMILQDPHILDTRDVIELEKRFQIKLKRQLSIQVAISYLVELGLLFWDDVSRSYRVFQAPKIEQIQTLLESLELEKIKKQRYQGLHKLVETIRSKNCRWQTICEYFGFEQSPCQICDNCQNHAASN